MRKLRRSRIRGYLQFDIKLANLYILMNAACSYGSELPISWASGFGMMKSLPSPNALAPNTRYVMAGVTAVSWPIDLAINMVDSPKKRTCDLDQRFPG